jgi:hypothetical protein
MKKKERGEKAETGGCNNLTSAGMWSILTYNRQQQPAGPPAVLTTYSDWLPESSNLQIPQATAMKAPPAIALLASATLALTGVAADYKFTSPTDPIANAADFYCGPASAQMVLNATSVAINPLPTQKALFTTARANMDPSLDLSNNKLTGVDSTGLRQAIANADPTRTYVAYKMASVDEANRTLAYNISHYNVPGVAVVWAGRHDIAVYGFTSDVQPTPENKDIKIKSFFCRDPWSQYIEDMFNKNNLSAAQRKEILAALGPVSFGGAGLCTASAELFNTIDGKGLWNLAFTKMDPQYITPFLKKGAALPAYAGTWAFITDPDEDDQSDPSAPAPGDATPISLSSAPAEALLEITSDNGEGGDATLTSLPSFENGAFSSADEEPIADPQGGTDFLVPYEQGVSNIPTAAVLLEGATGGMLGAFWNDDGSAIDLTDLETGLASTNSLAVNDNWYGITLSLALTTTNTLVLTWPAATLDTAIQQSPTLIAPTWTVVTNVPALIGCTNQMIITPSAANMFYQLGPTN